MVRRFIVGNCLVYLCAIDKKQNKTKHCKLLFTMRFSGTGRQMINLFQDTRGFIPPHLSCSFLSFFPFEILHFPTIFLVILNLVQLFPPPLVDDYCLSYISVKKKLFRSVMKEGNKKQRHNWDYSGLR